MFQHTAARRRLGFSMGSGCSCRGFNTQPPEGGWMSSRLRPVEQNSFNTQPPEGGWISHSPAKGVCPCFNTQPPEGGWVLEFLYDVWSTSFNTQPPEGGWQLILCSLGVISLFQHTAARRRLDPLSKALLHQVSQPRFR